MSAHVLLKDGYKITSSHPRPALLWTTSHTASNYTTTGVCDVTQGKLQVCVLFYECAYTAHTHARIQSPLLRLQLPSQAHAGRGSSSYGWLPHVYPAKGLPFLSPSLLPQPGGRRVYFNYRSVCGWRLPRPAFWFPAPQLSQRDPEA